MTPDDRELMGRCAASDDQEAFALLVDRWYARLLAFAHGTGLRHGEAEDCIQETFIRAWSARHRYDPRYRVQTWLFTITHRLAISALRRRRHHADLDAVPEPVAGLPAAANEPDQDLWQEAARVLSEKHLRVLWLHYVEAVESKEIASIMGLSAIGARVTLHRARQRLERHLRSQPAWQPVIEELAT